MVAHRAGKYGGGRIRAEVFGDEIRLVDLGSVQIFGQIPFIGHLSQEGEGCVLTGGFPVSAVLSWRQLLAFWLLAVVLGSLFGVPLPVMALVSVLWLLLAVGMIVLVNQGMISRRRRILQFLEQEMKT